MKTMEEVVALYPGPNFHHVVSMVELGKLIHRYSPSFALKILLTDGHMSSPGAESYINDIRSYMPSMFIIHLPSVTAARQGLSRTELAFHTMRLSVKGVSEALENISLDCQVIALVTSAIYVPFDFPNIPTYYHFTSCASALSVFLYFPTLHERTNRSFKDQGDAVLSDLPGLPPVRAIHMPEPVLDQENPAYNLFLDFSASLHRFHGIILNTFESLEPRAIRAITEGECVPGGTTPPVYCIGPLVSDAKDRLHPASSHGGESLSASVVELCLSWLDNQPSKSVVFLCFGSRGAFLEPQLKEIATGLEQSGHRFLWVVKNLPPDISSEPDLDALLPEGFLERTHEKGIVVKSWAPQNAVLKHGSVGGFVTHCGWNSVMEAVCTGVPMAAWPLYAEQKMNCAVLVEEMGIAIPIMGENRGEGDVVSAEEVERKVRELMDMEEGKEGRIVRDRIEAMKDSAMDAWRHGGSSLSSFSNLLASWKLQPQPNTLN